MVCHLLTPLNPPTQSPENFRAFFVFLSIVVYFPVNKCDNTRTRSTTRRDKRQTERARR